MKRHGKRGLLLVRVFMVFTIVPVSYQHTDDTLTVRRTLANIRSEKVVARVYSQ